MSRMLRPALTVLGALLVIAVVALAILYVVGSSRWSRSYDLDMAALAVPTDSASLARGAHLVETNGCADCHGADLSGQIMADAPPFRAVASNLTSGRGGIGGTYSVEDWDRTIRHGVRPDGRPVIIMPSAAFHGMSDADAAALIAYLRSVPPVDHELPATEVRALGKLLASFALDPAMEVNTGRPPRSGTPTADDAMAFGEYLSGITCSYCHGDDLRGAEAKMPGSPPPPDLVATATSWSLDEWTHALRTGERPDGSVLAPEYMPWSFTAAMTDQELEALYRYVRQLQGATPR